MGNSPPPMPPYLGVIVEQTVALLSPTLAHARRMSPAFAGIVRPRFAMVPATLARRLHRAQAHAACKAAQGARPQGARRTDGSRLGGLINKVPDTKRMVTRVRRYAGNPASHSKGPPPHNSRNPFPFPFGNASASSLAHCVAWGVVSDPCCRIVMRAPLQRARENQLPPCKCSQLCALRSYG